MRLMSLFARPAFIPNFSDYSSLENVGMTGHRGVLGGILYSRLAEKRVNVHVYEADVNDERKIENWFRGKSFSHFFHFAALVPVNRVEADPLLAFQTNVVGTFNVVKNWIRTQAKQSWFFYCSSSHVYQPACGERNLSETSVTNPETFYGVTKLTAEHTAESLLKKLNFPFCIGRVFSFSHITQREPYLVPTLRRRIAEAKEGDTLDISNSSSVRDIQDAETVVDCVLHLAKRRAEGVVNIGTGEGKSVREIAEALVKASGKHLKLNGTDKETPGRLVADTTRLQSLLRP